MSKPRAGNDKKIRSTGKGSSKDASRVVSPNYYQSRSSGQFHQDIECVDAMIAALGEKGFSNYCIGCAMKYLWRFTEKNGREDLEKAVRYIGYVHAIMDQLEETDGKPV